MEVERIFHLIVAVALSAVIGILFINMGTVAHEFFHWGAARSLGCEASFGTNIFTGSCNFDCLEPSATKNVLIAFASLFGVFFVGLALWFFAGENSLVRLGATTLFFYSLMPSAFPILNGSDASYIVAQGFPAWIMWAFWFITTGVVFYLVIKEIQDENFIFKFIKGDK